jgi:threonine synthase
VLVNSLNPYRLEGQKTAAFEILEELGAPPAVLALPYGGGGNTRAYVMGFEEAGAGSAADRRGRVFATSGDNRVGHPISAPVHALEVEQALERTGGLIAKVSDEALLEAWRALAQEEGIFCESGLGSRGGRPRKRRARGGHAGGLRHHRAWAQGPLRQWSASRHRRWLSTPIPMRSRQSLECA